MPPGAVAPHAINPFSVIAPPFIRTNNIHWNPPPKSGLYVSNYLSYTRTIVDPDCNYSNVLTAVSRSPSLTEPIENWELVSVTRLTNYSDVTTNNAMFYHVFFTNVVNGDKSP